MSENKKADTKKRVTLEVPVEKRAAGVKLPFGNPLIIARGDGSKLPENLARVFEKIEKHGKDGVRLNTICPKSSEGRYARWLIRTLVKLEAVKAVPEEAATTKPKASKKLTIAGAVAKKKRHLAKAGAAPAEAVAKSA